MKNILIFGYQGLGNIGDDLMFKAIKSEHENFILESNKNTYHIDDEIRLEKKVFFKKLFTSDVLYISGGNIFSYERWKSLFKILFLFVIFFIRKLQSKKTVIDSVGLNLKTSKLWRYLVCCVLMQSNNIYLRDSLSYRYFRRFFDSNVSFNYDRVYRTKDYIKTLLIKDAEYIYDEKYVLWFISEPAFKSRIKEIDIDRVISSIGSNKVIFFCQQESDIMRVNDIVKHNKINHEIYNYKYTELSKALSLINNACYIITERYHGALLSEVFSKEWVQIDYSEKLSRVEPRNFIK